MNPPPTTAEKPSPSQIRRTGITPPSRRGGSGRRLDDVLVELGFVDRKQMDAAIEEAERTNSAPERVLVNSDKINEEQLSKAVAERFGLDHLDLTVYRFDPNAAKLVTPAAVKRYQAIPVNFVNDRTLLVAMADPANVLAVDDIAVMTGYEVRPAVAAVPDIEHALERLKEASKNGAIVDDVEVEDASVVESAGNGKAAPLYDLDLGPVKLGQDEDASIIGLVHKVISEAVERGASDIHFEPFEEEMKVRYRIDGVLLEAATIPPAIVPTIISRVKILADLDIAERRIPQDGRVSMDLEGKRIDIRVVTLPTSHGESVVMRILDQSNVMIQLDQLGMLPQARERFTKAFHQAHGAVLVTGPTGSGKTTTLYAALTAVNTPEKTIITVEDPVEYELQGVKQVQVNTRTGLSFAAGLRAMVRADPDIIMVGEVRDRETAQIAIESALTGHLVLTTIHTNDAPLAVARLIEMGIEPYLVASGVECVVAQRLARRLCDCKVPKKLTKDALSRNGFAVARGFQAFEPAGCVRCAGSGFKGRIGLYELMPITDQLRRMILEKASADDVRETARSEGMRTLREDGLEKIRRGVTSVSEVLRVLGT